MCAILMLAITHTVPTLRKLMRNENGTDLSLSRKNCVIDELDKNISQSDIARCLGISQSQVSCIAAKTTKICLQWERNENPDPKRRHPGKVADVETALKNVVY